MKFFQTKNGFLPLPHHWIFCLLMAASLPVFAQNGAGNKPPQSKVNVDGKITDEKGQGIAGASITVKGSRTATTSDADGNFHLLAEPGKDILEISYIGYQTKEAPVSGAHLSISMTAAGKAMEDVVVIGYGTQKRREVTAA